MPNGRGQIDCCYCLHWSTEEEEWGYASGRYDGKCNCWDVAIPRHLTTNHRFCLDFVPNKYFAEDNGVGHPEFDTGSEEQIARARLRAVLLLKPELRLGLLYHYPNHELENAAELMKLDQQT
jgi:hypothetical protein